MLSFYRIWWILLAAKLLLGISIPLSYDEAYYWVWSKDLQLSYFDHPAMVAWWFKLGEIFDFLHAVRLPSIVLAHLSFLVWREVFKDKLSSQQLCWWMLLCGLNPLIFLSGTVITPDTPLMLFWSLSVLFLKRSLIEGKLTHYLALGAALGLGFCSKYNIVIFVPLVLALLLLSKAHRQKVKWQFVPLTILSGLIFSTPVLWWNLSNEFISFKFQLDHGLGATEWKSYWTTSYIAGQLAILSPLLFLYGLKWRNLKAFPLFYVFGWGPIFFFFLTSFKGLVEANWPLIGYPAVIAAALVQLNDRARYFTLGYFLFIFAFAGSLLVHPWMNLKPLEIKKKEVVGPKETYPYVHSDLPLYASSYQLASKITYDTGVSVPKLKGVSRVDHYDFQARSVPQGEFLFLAHDIFSYRDARKNYIVDERIPINEEYTLYRMRPK